MDNSKIVWIIAAQNKNYLYERSSQNQSNRKPNREFKKLISNGLWLFLFCSGWACALLNNLYTKNTPENSELSLHDLLMLLPKEVLVEHLDFNILENPLNDGIRAYRGLFQQLDKAIDENKDGLNIEAFARPMMDHINLLFDLHESINHLVAEHDFATKAKAFKLEQKLKLERKHNDGE